MNLLPNMFGTFFAYEYMLEISCCDYACTFWFKMTHIAHSLTKYFKIFYNNFIFQIPICYSCPGSHRSMARSGRGTSGSSQNVNSEHNGTSHHRHCFELVEFGSFPLDSSQEFGHIHRWLCRMHHGYIRCTPRYRRKLSKWSLKSFKNIFF